MLISPEALHKIRRLQIRALHDVEDLFGGLYRSVFKGQGLEFEDLRPYQPGDEIRAIDWNVTARSAYPVVKNFREERELTLFLVVDLSASSRFSHTSHSKSELIAEVAALLAFSAIKNQDKVGLLLFSNEIELYLKPKKGVRHVLRVIRDLLYFVPRQKGTNLEKALAFLARVQKKHAICFLLSDFLTKDFSRPATLVAKRHELIAFHLYDSHEYSFAPQGLFRLRDLETDEERVVDTADTAVQAYFKKQAEEEQTDWRHLFKRLKVPVLSMHTGEAPVEILQRFFKKTLRQRKSR